MRRFRWSLLLLAPVVAVSCFRQVNQETEIAVPELKTEEQAQYVVNMLTNICPDGITRAKADLVKHTIRVSYNTDVLRIRNIEGMIAEFGLAAGNSRPPEKPRFKMPAPQPAVPSAPAPGVKP